MPILQTPNEFLEDFVSEINKAEKNVCLQTMNFETGKVMSVLEEALVNAVKRGVRVEINFDWVSQRFVHDRLPLLPAISPGKRKYVKNLWEKDRRMVERLKAAGIKMNKTNTPFFPLNFIPFMGRNHIKMYVVDGKIGWIGGLNLFDIAFENVDFMVKITDGKIIDVLLSQFKRINKNRAAADYTVSFDKNYSLTIDNGAKVKSLIYNQTLNAVKKAEKSIVFMSQFIPDSSILRSLINASKKGTMVKIITSPQNNVIFKRYPERLSYLYFKNSIKNNPNIRLIHLGRTVHAKLILIDGEKALFGSHNFTYSGVIFGTEEIMMTTMDPELIAQIKKFVEISLSAS